MGMCNQTGNKKEATQPPLPSAECPLGRYATDSLRIRLGTCFAKCFYNQHQKATRAVLFKYNSVDGMRQVLSV